MTTEILYQLGYGQYVSFQKFISQHSGLHFPENRRSELEKGILKALSAAPDGITNVESYYAYLNQSGVKEAKVELDRLINILTIGETHFFRNNAQFDALATHVLPKLIAQKREAAALVSRNSEPVPQLRIWSAGCATGEEPYSIAILLRELIPDIEKWRIFILGTDINADSLARACAATYREWSFREDEAKSKRQIYFKQEGNQYHLNDAIRRQVTFTQHNLIEDDFPSAGNGIVAMDLILCRNVTIYFSQETTQQLIKKFYNTLVDEGWLLVGHSEPSIIAYQDFHSCSYPKAILYQKARRPAPPYIGGEYSGNIDSKPNLPLPTSKLIDRNLTRRLEQTKTRLAIPQTGLLNQQIPVFPKLGKTAMLRESIAEVKKAAAEHYEEAQLLLLQGKAEKAVQILEAIIAQDERYVPAYSLLAHVHADLGQYLQARSWSQRAIKYDSLNPKAYYILALMDVNDGFLKQAINNFKKMIYIDANNPLPHFHLAILYRKEGQTEMSQHALDNSIKILQKLPADAVLPESGESVGWLLQMAREMWAER